MLDCLSNGRIDLRLRPRHPARVQRLQRAARASRAPASRRRGRSSRRAWTEEVFSYEGRFWSYEDVAIWPRPVQQPHPPVWVPVTGSKETIEWAGRAQHPDHARAWADAAGCARTSSATTRSASPQHGHRITPDHLIIQASAYVADSKAQAVKEAGPYTLYFNRTLFSHGNVTETDAAARGRLSSAVARSTTCGRRTCARRRALRERFPRHDDGRRRARRPSTMPWGTRRRGRRAHHRRRRQRRRQHGAARPEPRRHAARDVHGPDPSASPARCCPRCRRTR